MGKSSCADLRVCLRLLDEASFVSALCNVVGNCGSKAPAMDADCALPDYQLADIVHTAFADR